jgi:dTMP kinase
MDKKGKFVVFDGGEGSGKTTVSKQAVEWLTKRGVRAQWTREPGGSQYAEKIRELILSPEAKEADAETMFALFWAARRDHLARIVLPALRTGTNVICDRFDSSTWAYQIAGQEQPQLRELFWQMRAHYLGDLIPHYVLFVVSPEIGLERARSRGAAELNHFDDRLLAFHKRVERGFSEFAEMVPKENFRAINANVSQAEVEEQAFSVLDQFNLS